MRPLTADKPKGLVEVAGKPLLTHVFETLLDHDVDALIVIIGYRGDQIAAYYGNSFGGVSISYVRQAEQRGLAHALCQAAPQIDGPFLWLNGDNILRGNTGAVLDRFRNSGASVATFEEAVSPEQATKGAVFERRDGEITGLVEKPSDPPSTTVPRGFFVFSPAIIPACRLVTPGETGEYELTDAIDLLLHAGHTLETVELSGWCANINSPEERDRIERKLQELKG